MAGNGGAFRVRELAQERKLTQERLAQLSGLSVSVIARIWTNKTTDPPYTTLRKIADALQVSISDLESREVSSGNMRPALLAIA